MSLLLFDCVTHIWYPVVTEISFGQLDKISNRYKSNHHYISMQSSVVHIDMQMHSHCSACSLMLSDWLWCSFLPVPETEICMISHHQLIKMSTSVYHYKTLSPFHHFIIDTAITTAAVEKQSRRCDRSLRGLGTDWGDMICDCAWACANAMAYAMAGGIRPGARTSGQKHQFGALNVGSMGISGDLGMEVASENNMDYKIDCLGI
jgi:hypothetical protein